MSMEPKTVLVTGATGGIGQAVCQAFATEGCRNIAHTSHAPEKAQVLKTDLEARGAQVLTVQADLRDEEQVREVFSQIRSQYGRLDVLVHCAGAAKDSLLLRQSQEDFDEMLAVNLKSAALCAREAARIMLKQKSGSILTLSSVVGLHGNAGQCAYAAAKAGLVGLTKSLARELGSRGIRVNTIAPGFIETPMTARLGEAQREKLTGSLCLPRLGKPEDVAGAAKLLASDEAGYITGQVLCVDGGLL